MTKKTAAIRKFEDALRKNGVRITRQRQALLRALAEADDHPDAPELLKRASVFDDTVSLATVYRTLTVLEQYGLINKLSFDGEPARFETADQPHHDHIIDVETGDVIEFRSDAIEELQTRIAREYGYDIVHHRLELYGRKRR